METVHIWTDNKGTKATEYFPENFLKKGDSSSGTKWIVRVVNISTDKFQRWQINSEEELGPWCDTER